MAGSLLDALGDVERRAVMARMRRRRFGKGEVVFHEGDPGDVLHLVAKGRAAVRASTRQGEPAMLSVLVAGESFGELALVGGRIRTASVIALEPVETLSIRADDFEELRAANPAVDRFLVAVLAAQVERLTTLVLEALYLPVETRVLRRVDALCDVYRAEGLAPAVIPLTQDDIAAMAGTTRPTANRVLKGAEAEGLLTLHRGRLEVHDRDGLAKRAR